MSDFTWNGGAGSFNQASKWTDVTNPALSGSTYPKASDVADFITNGSVSGSGTVTLLMVELAIIASFTATISAVSIVDNGTLTIASGGMLKTTGETHVNGVMSLQGGGDLVAAAGTSLLANTEIDAGGTLTATGAGSTITTTIGGVVVGATGTGTLALANAAAAILSSSLGSSASMLIGQSAGSNGLVTVASGATLTTTTGGIAIGYSGRGTLALSGGATANIQSGDGHSSSLILGRFAGSNGLLTLTGGARFATTGGANIGDGGQGTLTINAGSTFAATATNPAGAAIGIGGPHGGLGTVSVSGAGSQLVANAGGMSVGSNGTGDLTVQAGAMLLINDTNLGLDIGTDPGGQGTVTLTGTNSSLNDMAGLQVGDYGAGTLFVLAGAMATIDYDLQIALQADSSGSATIDNALVQVDAGAVFVGEYGAGTLYVQNGGTVESAAGFVSTNDGGSGVATIANGLWSIADLLDIGVTAESQGTVVVTGGTSYLEVGGAMTVGDDGLGTLDIEDGGFVGAASLIVSNQPGSGTSTTPTDVTVNGAGSQLVIDSDATIDTAIATNDGAGGNWTYAASGTGTIWVGDGGYLSIGQALTLQSPNDPANPPVLTIGSGGAAEIGGYSTPTANQLLVDPDGLIIGHGTIASDQNGSLLVGDTPIPAYSLTIVDTGTIEAYQGTLVLDANVTGTGTSQSDGDSTGDPLVLVSDGSTLEFGGTVADDVTAMFLPSADGTEGDATITIDDPLDFEGTISSENFEPGDMIDLPNVQYVAPGSEDLNPDGASFYFETGEQQESYVLQVVVNDQTYNIPINKDAPLTGGFTLSADADGGTLITHTDGPVTGYSVTAPVDGPDTSSYAGVVRVDITEKGVGVRPGSGFAVGPKLILTAAHVANENDGNKVEVWIPGRATSVPGYIVKTNPNITFMGFGASTKDWAYIYLPTGNFSNADTFALQTSFQLGNNPQEVNVTGYPGIVNEKAVQFIGSANQYNEILSIKKSSGGFLVPSGLFQYFSYVNGQYVNASIAQGFSGGPTWIKNTQNDVGINITTAFSLPVTFVTTLPNQVVIPPDLLKGTPAKNAVIASLEPIANNASIASDSITSAVVIQTGDVDTGQTVQFVLDTSETVVVTGSGPTLSLNDGGTATYNAANSTGTELEFDYTVSAGTQTANLEITQVNSPVTVQGPGGTTLDFSVLDDLPTGLSINAPLVVTSVASSQTGEVDAGQSVQLTMTLSAAVTVTTAGGSPSLALNDGATATYNAAASNPSAGMLVFDYTVSSGDEIANLEVTSVALPTQTTVQNAAGFNADFAAALNAPTGLQVGPAYVTEITPSLTIDLTTGQTELLTLAMSQGVTVNTSGGSPTLSLSDGATATYDAAASNPSAGNLVFADTVGASDYTTDLQVLSYNPSGATVTDAHGVAADLSGATQYDLALDVNAATVTNLAVSPSTGEVGSGQAVTLTLTMSEAVTVNLAGGSPTLSLNDGGTATYDSAASNASAGTLVFADTVGASDETPSLQIGQVNLNGATIDDADGHAADFSAASTLTTTLQVGPAFVSSLTPALTGEIFTGQTDQLTLAMSQGVTVNTTNGAPTLSLSDGATATYDSAASDPSTGTLVFDYAVGAGDYTTDLTMLGYNPNGATVTDANGVNADFSSVATYDLGLDVNAAIVTDVTASPASGEADSGAPITVTLTMSEVVTVNTAHGAPSLSLSTGATATYDSAASNPSAGTLVFDDTVGAADQSPDLAIIQARLNGAIIDDASGNAADLSAASSFDTGLQIGPVSVDSVTPSLSGDITTGQTVQLTVSMSAGVTIDTAGGSPTLSLSDGATATYDTAASDPSAGTLVFDDTVAAGDYAAALSVVRLNAIGATIADANGVSPDFSALAESYLGLDVNAATVNNVTTSPASGEALSGHQVLLTLTMSEPVTVNLTAGTPTLNLSDGAMATYDSAASTPATGALVFTYTVGATDADPNLQIAQVRLNGATIHDANGNAADLSAAPTVATNLQIGSPTVIPCFLAGTRIATLRGEVPVEQLAIGDEVMTLRGEEKPIVWIGHRHIDCRRHPKPADVWPVRVRAGAFGDQVPQRDLWLSPDHAVFMDGVLIPIRHLVNDATVAQVPRDEVAYWHVELAQHQVLIAEGLPAESYLETGSRSSFSNATIEALHPTFVRTAESAWANNACAPLVESGPMLDAVRARLADRAARLGCPVPGVLDLAIDAAGCSSAIVPPDVRTVRLVSASARIGGDRRLLGALLTFLRIDGAPVALDDGSLIRGFHEAEWHGATLVRWTDGAGTIRLGPAPHPRVVVVDVAALGAVPGERRAA